MLAEATCLFVYFDCVLTNPLRFECQKLVLVGDPKVCETVVACCLLVFQSSYAPVAYPDNRGFPRHAKNGEKKKPSEDIVSKSC